MEDNFNQNNFEEFLKEQVRNHRMYPNDGVWRDIHTRLHGDKKWPALTIAACTILSATIAISVYFTPKPDIFAINPSANELKNSTLSNSQHNIGLDNLASSSLYKQKTSFAEPGKNKTLSVAPVSRDIYTVNNPVAATDKNKTIRPEITEVERVSASAVNNTVINKQSDLKQVNTPATVNAAAEVPTNFESLQAPTLLQKLKVSDIIKPLAQNPKVSRDYNDKNMADNFLKDHKDDISLHTASKIKNGKNKFGFQIYVAPSVSYRKLAEDPSVLKEGNNSGPVGLNYVADVNKVVRHKPGNGLEAGVSILYYLSDHFRLKSGFQFNVRQYSIEAYRSGTEVASIALVENNRIDTVTSLAIYRNNNGYYPAELVNRYYQLSVPIGLEWEIIGNKRVQFNIAGSIQPTYLINHNAYLLSTNFKNYSKDPDLVRSFNINSNIETYISFKAGNFKWQIGPQLRYQPYSTFIPQYPIKEHLLDYGIKLGLSKTF